MLGEIRCLIVTSSKELLEGLRRRWPAGEGKRGPTTTAACVGVAGAGSGGEVMVGEGGCVD